MGRAFRFRTFCLSNFFGRQNAVCYIISFSTTSLEVFTLRKLETMKFEPIEADGDAYREPSVENLRFPKRWYLICRYGGCSCHFRHVPAFSEEDPTFEAPQAWFPEDADDIESTEAAYEFFKGLVESGHEVDRVDAWNDRPADSIQTVLVNLSEITRQSFRFIEGYHFNFIEKATPPRLSRSPRSKSARKPR